MIFHGRSALGLAVVTQIVVQLEILPKGPFLPQDRRFAAPGGMISIGPEIGMG